MMRPTKILRILIVLALPLTVVDIGPLEAGGTAGENELSQLSLALGCVEEFPDTQSFVTKSMRDAFIGFLGPDHETPWLWFSTGLFEPAVPEDSSLAASFEWVRTESLTDGSSLRYGVDTQGELEVFEVSVTGASFYLAPDAPHQHDRVLALARSYVRGNCTGARAAAPISSTEPSFIWPRQDPR